MFVVSLFVPHLSFLLVPRESCVVIVSFPGHLFLQQHLFVFRLKACIFVVVVFFVFF